MSERSVDDIMGALVARYCGDNELWVRINNKALAQQEPVHGDGEELCVWCGLTRGRPNAFVSCPRCRGSGVDPDPEACIPGRGVAFGRGLGSTEDPLPISGRRILCALVNEYLDDEELRAQIDEGVDPS